MSSLKRLWFAAVLGMAIPAAFADIPTTGSGTVAELIDVDQYTYVRLAETGDWLAISQTALRVGDKITYAGGALMKDFTSRTLDRSFDEILFVMSFYVTDEAPMEADAQALVEHAHKAAGEPAVQPPVAGEIVPAEGGMTIAEIYAGYGQLDGQNVTIRGRVMKFSEKILGTNWITLQDGSGTPPDNKLVARTQQTVGVGDEITVQGKVATDVSLGTGYEYKLLLEDAQAPDSQ